MTCVSSTPSMTNGIDATKRCGHSARHRDLEVMAGHGIKHQFSELGGYVRDAGCRCFRW